MNRDGSMYGNNRNVRGGRMPGYGVPDGRNASNASEAFPGQCGCAANSRIGANGRMNTEMASQMAMAVSVEECADAAEFAEIPCESQEQLLKYIDEVSFCAYDLMLYLDTHPKDENALDYFRKYNHRRSKALHIYEEKYGPLRYGRSGPDSVGSVKWVSQPWPWEGGVC